MYDNTPQCLCAVGCIYAKVRSAAYSSRPCISNHFSKEPNMFYYLKKAWFLNLMAVICLIVQNIFKVGVSLALMQSFQKIIERDLQQFLLQLSIMILFWIIVFALSVLQTAFQNYAMRKMDNMLRADIACGILQTSYQALHERNLGESLSQFTNDINEIKQRAWLPFYQLIGTVALVVVSMAALASLHWLLLIMALFTAVLMVLIPKLFERRLNRIAKAFSARQSEALSSFKDLLSGYDVLHFFGKDDRFKNGIHAASDAIETSCCRLNITQSKIFNGISMLNLVFQGLVMALMGWLSIQGLIIQSALLGGNTICGNVYNGLQSIVDLQLSIAASRPYFDKITVHAAGDKPAISALPALRQGISVQNVSFCYDEKKTILKDLNARFEKGGKYALTGPSGCGKSTLLKILLGWLPGYEGIVAFDGVDMQNYTPEQLQQQMSYIEQNVFLFNTTIRENITLGGNFTEEEMQKALRDSALLGDLANMPEGLDTFVGEEGSSLSGGQKQRVAIARALIHNRSILLVDEGTSALDQKNADIVEESLLSNPDLTLILISHHLSEERKKQFTQVYELTPATTVTA